MHYALTRPDIKVAPAYFGNSRHFARCSLVDHSVGSVHMGLGLCELKSGGYLDVHYQQPPPSGIGLEEWIHQAFVGRDPAKARALIPRDKQIDSLNKQLQRELASYMVERPSTITRCLNLMTISKSLERIGDHATNIAEEVVYLHEGEDIRHDPKIKGEAR